MATAIVYIDGFNFFYRNLKGGPHKWVNPALLAQYLLPHGTTIQQTRYFTAYVKPLPTNPDAPVRQQAYLRALRTIPNLSVHLGQFMTKETMMPLAAPPASGPKFVRVLRTEEKGTDVNLAVHLLHDAFQPGSADIALLLTNDSDLEEAIRLVRDNFNKQIWLALPLRGRPSVQLRKLAHQVRPIRESLLKAAQFPDTIQDQHGTITKPAGW